MPKLPDDYLNPPRALSEYPEDFNDFAFIKYINEHSKEYGELCEKRREIFNWQELQEKYWRLMPPPSFEFVMDILKNGYFSDPDFIRVYTKMRTKMKTREDQVRAITAHIAFSQYLKCKYDKGIDSDYDNRQRQFDSAKMLAYEAFDKFVRKNSGINSADDPEIEKFIRQKLAKKHEKYQAALEREKARKGNDK